MQFTFHNPTKIIFGAGNISRLGEVAGEYGRNALRHSLTLEQRKRII